MAFQTKAFLSIVASMINYMRGATTKISDFNVGSIARVMVEAPAIEMDELYQQMVNGLTQAIPVSTYNTFNFPALTAAAATGPIRVTIEAATTATDIPAGSVFSRPDGAVTYTSIADIVIAAGNTFGDVPVVATTTGSVTNTAAGTVFTLAPAVQGMVSATNLAAFSTGSDTESPSQRQTRFQAYITSLARGTVAACLYGAETTKLYDANGNITEQVKFASLVEPWETDPTQPVGLINMYVHNGVGSTSGTLVAAALQIVTGYVNSAGVNVPGYKAAGTKLTLVASTEVPVNVTAQCTALPGYDEAALAVLAQQAIYTYILGLAPGATAQFATMVELGIGITGMENFVISAPLVDTPSTLLQKFMPGNLAIT